MACSSCTQRRTFKYAWTNGTDTIIYNSEIQAKAKVLRSGGSYTAQPPK